MYVWSYWPESWLTAGQLMKPKQLDQRGFVFVCTECFWIRSLPPRYDYLCVCTPVWLCVASHKQPVLCMWVNMCTWRLRIYMWVGRGNGWLSRWHDARPSLLQRWLRKQINYLNGSCHLCPVNKHKILHAGCCSVLSCLLHFAPHCSQSIEVMQ